MSHEILRAYKFRIYPNKTQQVKLNKTFGCVRFLWNQMTANFNSWTPDIMPSKLTEKELKPQYEFLSEVSAAALQQKRIDFDETKKQYFNKSRKKKLGKPSFKKKVNRQSYRLPNQKFKLDQTNSKIKLEKIGSVKVILDRIIQPDADYRSITISRIPSGEYFVSILVKEQIQLSPITERVVGIDLGIKDLLVMSSGHVVNNPRWFGESQVKLARNQRHLSRKIRGSNRYQKQRIRVAKIHRDITNQRDYFLHNLSTDIIKQFDLICLENLSVANMVKNRKLSKVISDVSWSKLVNMLEYKAHWYGKTVIMIDKFYPSSKLCHVCGHRLDKLDLSVRSWVCPKCNTTHNRDHNAAMNILHKGYSDLTGIELNKSAECVDHIRGEDIRLMSRNTKLAASVKRLSL